MIYCGTTGWPTSVPPGQVLGTLPHISTSLIPHPLPLLHPYPPSIWHTSQAAARPGLRLRLLSFKQGHVQFNLIFGFSPGKLLCLPLALLLAFPGFSARPHIHFVHDWRRIMQEQENMENLFILQDLLCVRLEMKLEVEVKGPLFAGWWNSVFLIIWVAFSHCPRLFRQVINQLPAQISFELDRGYRTEMTVANQNANVTTISKCGKYLKY